MQTSRLIAVLAPVWLALTAAGPVVSGGHRVDDVTPNEVGARHLRLVRAEPAVDTTVVAPPRELKLYFSEAVRPGVAAVRLIARDSTPVTLGALAAGSKGADAHPPIVAPITGAVRPGSYRVQWRVTGADGHTISGDFGFTVKSAAAAAR